ncbi:Chemotaxis protein methyltransferase [Vibrio cholerae]|nr:Chemotaxis protein methyltransferase [Vibrio cholerae]
MKSKVLNQMAASLNPGGYLLLGASERVGSSQYDLK